MGANRSSPTLRHMASDTITLPEHAEGIAEAVHILRRGGLVAMPTETVYGLAATPPMHRRRAHLRGKGAAQFNPLIVHVPGLEAAEHVAVFDDVARTLAQAFWPARCRWCFPCARRQHFAAGNCRTRQRCDPRARPIRLHSGCLQAFGGSLPLAPPARRPPQPSGRVLIYLRGPCP